MKRFSVPCEFGEEKVSFNLYVGLPSALRHPIFYQSEWLRIQRGGLVPSDVYESFGKLSLIARENNVSFEDLCVYAMGEKAHAPKEIDDNVIYANFAKINRTASEEAPSLNDIESTKFFGIFDLKKSEAPAFIVPFVSEIVPVKSQAHEFYRSLLRALLTLILHRRANDSESKNWMDDLREILANQDPDQALYQLSVCLDAFGTSLPMDSQMCLEFFLNSSSGTQDFAAGYLCGVLNGWAESKSKISAMKPYESFGISVDDFIRLKELFKPSFAGRM